jgi:mRNA interferase RelE/StbE
MSWRLEWTRHAVKDVEGIDRQVRERIVRAIEHLAQTEQGDVTSLKKPLRGYRLRVGDWRVSFERNVSAGVIIVRRVRHRSQACRKS